MIKKLSVSYAPSGREEEVRNIIINDLKDFYLDIKTDNLGNLIVHKKGKSRTIAITAPMDEVGFLVTHVDDDNILNTASIGTVNSNTLHSILLKDCNGNLYINADSDDFTENSSKITNFKLMDLNGCNAEKLYNDFTGNTLVFNDDFRETEQYFVGKALERSVSCKILCDIARMVSDSMYEYYFVFSAQNYCDKKGAQTALYDVKIDELYNICGINSDADVKFQNGPYVILRDKNFISSEIVNNYPEFNKFSKVVTDKLVCEAGFWQRNHKISNVAALAVPILNLYTSNEVVNKDDVKVLTDALAKVVLP